MGSRGLRVLVLACCLPLVLPPGWCCYLLVKIDPQATTFYKTNRTTPANSAWACCCHTHDPLPQPQNTDEKKPQEPQTPPVKHCPCSDRQTTPPSFSSVEPDDGGLVFFVVLPFTDSPPPVIGGAEKAVPVARPPACPIHIRNCVWRC